VLLLAGLVMSLPLADEGAQTSSLSLAAGILFGFLELLADAIPGIAIRLRTTLLAPEHYLAVHRTWGPSRLHDQQLGGAIVWFLAETIDLPVLALLVFRWIRTDEREAIVIDRRLDQQEQELASVDAEVDLQRPWWETDATVFGDRRAAALRKSSGRSRRPGS
jgi:putative copper resistance protein D